MQHIPAWRCVWGGGGWGGFLCRRPLLTAQIRGPPHLTQTTRLSKPRGRGSPRQADAPFRSRSCIENRSHCSPKQPPRFPE